MRALDKTNFFTKEVDELQLSGRCRISIHSAKDLPDPIPDGLKIIAVTKGQDPRDALVMRPGDNFESLPANAIIATSSHRREEVVKSLRHDLRFIDLRGTIHQRLSLLEAGKADGVIVAEAALLRLGLTHLNRFYLPGDTAPFQGQLAILARENDSEMEELFQMLRYAQKGSISWIGRIRRFPFRQNHSLSDDRNCSTWHFLAGYCALHALLKRNHPYYLHK